MQAVDAPRLDAQSDHVGLFVVFVQIFHVTPVVQLPPGARPAQSAVLLNVVHIALSGAAHAVPEQRHQREEDGVASARAVHQQLQVSDQRDGEVALDDVLHAGAVGRDGHRGDRVVIVAEFDAADEAPSGRQMAEQVVHLDLARVADAEDETAALRHRQ